MLSRWKSTPDNISLQLKHDESEKTAGKKRKAVLKGIYHIQTVNSYHIQISLYFFSSPDEMLDFVNRHI